MNDMSKSGKIGIGITLNGKMAERFNWMKDRFDVKNNSELIRLLVSLVWRAKNDYRISGQEMAAKDALTLSLCLFF